MSMEIPPELIIEGIARAVGGWLARPEVEERIVNRVAELRSELMTTAEASDLLRVCTKTLKANHVEWEMDKSVALGANEPRFFRSQVMERMKSKVVKGRRPAAGKVVAMNPDEQRRAG